MTGLLSVLIVLARRLLVFLCQVVTDNAAADGTEYCVMVGIVPGDTADNGALDAALSVGRNCGCRYRQ